jgi:hypothetical protein
VHSLWGGIVVLAWHGIRTVSQPGGGACMLRPGAWTHSRNQFGVPIRSDIVHETSPADKTARTLAANGDLVHAVR